MLSNGFRRKASKKSDAFSPFPSDTQASSPVVVTVRTVLKPKAKPTVSNSNIPERSPTPRVATPASSASSSPRPSAKPQKRKYDASQEHPNVRRVRTREHLSDSPSPRSARSSQPIRPTQAFGSLEKPIPRPCVITEDGDVPHVTSEDVIMRILRQQEDFGKKTKWGYRAYFRNPDDPEDKSFEPSATNPPVVEIEYPNHKASERFILLFPWDKDNYQPVRELMKVLSTITECYLKPAQRAPFGTLTTSILPSTPSSRPLSPSPGSDTPVPETEPLMRTLQKAYHTRNGPLFVRTVSEISSLLKAIKFEMMANALALFDVPVPLTLDGTSSGGVPVRVWKMICEEVYQRSVGPDVEDTKKYRSFSSETYGELNPSFVSDIVQRLGLKPGKTFVDLGCGVGNCVLQASLQSGCTSYGIEINHPVAALGFRQETEFLARLRMWGLYAGPVTLREGDFCDDNEVVAWIRKADVILVNNYIFSSDLNDALTWRFLDLPEGAKVVVLKPFWPINRPLTQRTADSPEAVLTNVERLEYFSDSVSWTKEPGEFFIYTKTDSRQVFPFETDASGDVKSTRTHASGSSIERH